MYTAVVKWNPSSCGRSNPHNNELYQNNTSQSQTKPFVGLSICRQYCHFYISGGCSRVCLFLTLIVLGIRSLDLKHSVPPYFRSSTVVMILEVYTRAADFYFITRHHRRAINHMLLSIKHFWSRNRNNSEIGRGSRHYTLLSEWH